MVQLSEVPTGTFWLRWEKPELQQGAGLLTTLLLSHPKTPLDSSCGQYGLPDSIKVPV